MRSDGARQPREPRRAVEQVHRGLQFVVLIESLRLQAGNYPARSRKTQVDGISGVDKRDRNESRATGLFPASRSRSSRLTAYLEYARPTLLV